VNFGCSASFVSKEGLLITNHHCATSALQTNSTPSEDLLKNGILAKTRAEERSSGPSARLNVLSKTTDVTDQVRGALDKTPDDLARELEFERLQKDWSRTAKKAVPGRVAAWSACTRASAIS